VRAANLNCDTPCRPDIISKQQNPSATKVGARLDRDFTCKLKRIKRRPQFRSGRLLFPRIPPSHFDQARRRIATEGHVRRASREHDAYGRAAFDRRRRCGGADCRFEAAEHGRRRLEIINGSKMPERLQGT